MLAVNVSPDIETRAARMAKSTGRPLAEVIEAALSEGLSELEEIEEAEARLADIRSGKVKPLSHEELFGDGVGT